MKRVLFLIALLFAAPVWAQTAILQGGNWTAGHGLVYAPGSSSGNPIVIDSGAAPGSGIITSSAAGQIPYFATTGTSLIGNANVTVSGGALRIGVVGTTGGSLLLSGSGTGTITLKGLSGAGTYNWIFPTTAGTAGYPLISGGGGSTEMSWGTLSGNTTKFGTVSGSLTSGHCLSADASGNLVDNGSSCGGSGTVTSGTAGQFAYYPSSATSVSSTGALTVSGLTLTTGGALIMGGAFTASPANANITISPTGTGTITINPATLGALDNVTIGATTKAAGSFTTLLATSTLSGGVAGSSLGSLALSGNTSGTITIKPQAAAGTFNLNLPTTAGTSGQPMLSGGGGASAMTWGSLSGNTSSFATTSGSLTNGHGAAFDASGNIVDGGTYPTGTINSGTSGQMTYYAGTGTAVSGNANVTYSAGALQVGVAGSQAGSVLVTGSTSGTITVKGSGVAIGTYNFNLPTTAGTASQPLLSAAGGSSAMTWGSLTGTTSTFGTATGSFTSGNCVTTDANHNLVDNGSPCGTGGSGTVVSGTAGQIAYYPSSTASVSSNANISISGSDITLGVTGSALGTVGLAGSTSGKVTLKPQAAAGTYNFNLPNTAGTAGQVLTSQGGGSTAMTWGSAGAAWAGVQSTGFTASSNNSYCTDTTSAAFTLTLPASPTDGDLIQILDCKGTFATNNLTVARNGNKIMGLTQNMTVSTNNASFYLRYVGANTDWRVQ